MITGDIEPFPGLGFGQAGRHGRGLGSQCRTNVLSFASEPMFGFFFFYGGMIDVFQVCLSLSDCVVFVDHVLPAIVPKVT